VITDLDIIKRHHILATGRSNIVTEDGAHVFRSVEEVTPAYDALVAAVEQLKLATAEFERTNGPFTRAEHGWTISIEIDHDPEVPDGGGDLGIYWRKTRTRDADEPDPDALLGACPRQAVGFVLSGDRVVIAYTTKHAKFSGTGWDGLVYTKDKSFLTAHQVEWFARDLGEYVAGRVFTVAARHGEEADSLSGLYEGEILQAIEDLGCFGCKIVHDVRK